MSEKEIEIASQFDQMNKVVEELLKGNTPTQISKTLDIPRAQVSKHIDNWKQFVQDSSMIKDRAKEALAGADQHYQLLIKEAWKSLEDADQAGELGNKNTAIKIIADIEAKRIDMLNKAGVLEESDVAQQILESEKKQEVLISILRDVTANCDKCKFEVASRLQEVTGKLEAVVVDE